jgi:DNA (cytosine-5)-methyltransferase 1
MDKLGYNVSFRLLRAQFYDVAQKRERLIIIGVKKGLEMPFVFPKARDYIMTLAEALKGCPPSEGASYPERKAFIMSQVPEGGNWRDLPIHLQKEYMKGSFLLGGGKTGMARRLSMGEPSLTLVCTPAQAQTERCHPTETRPITIRESARIQSFPDDWNFVGSVASKYKQIGNAVPVNLAFHVGRCLVAMLSGKVEPETMIIQKAAEKQLDWVAPEQNSFLIKEMEWINSIKPQEAASCRP